MSMRAPSIERRREDPVAARLAWPGDLHPVLRQVYARRALHSPAELDLALGALVPVGTFTELEGAVDLVLRHADRRIVVVGDFDSDGATSTALVARCLRAFGCRAVEPFVPDRFALGYGLSEAAVARIAPMGPSLIITVDNGISSVAGVAAARRAGIDVLVTDHHLPPDRLPDANAILNPNVPGVTFAGKSLAGVGVAFYLMAAVGRAVGDTGTVAAHLDLVALGTVADLVPLDHQNRILVQQGLARIRRGACRPGIRALCEVAGVDVGSVSAATLGYQLGPRLNAAGRLDDMSLGVRCLVTDSLTEARVLAGELDRLNRERRSLERRMRDEALAIVDAIALERSRLDRPVLCLCRTDWHEGLVGLVAGRVKDQWWRPTFAFSPSERGTLKGSGRSIPGFHLRDALAEVDMRNPGLIIRFGGHAMAAGLELEVAQYARFEQAIADVAQAKLSAGQLERRIYTDGELAPQHFDVDVARLLRDAGPWGQAFPEPLFDGTFEINDCRWLQDAHLQLKLRPVAGRGSVDAIYFNAPEVELARGERVTLAFRLGVDDFRAVERARLFIEHLER
jgi:single-stranded-DNA-specific exonuclease